MSAGIRTLGANIDHPEGVCWDPSGAIVVGTEAGQVLWLDPDSGEVRLSVDVGGGGFIGGIALDARGRAYACDLGQGRVVRVDPASRSAETYSTGPVEDPFQVPNYPVFAASGHLFVSDSRDWGAENGLIVVVAPDGNARVGSREAAGFTNGMALSPDGNHLYVVESTPPRIVRLPVDGSALGPKEGVVEMPRTVPDGVAFANDGRLLISCYRPDAIYVWDGDELRVLAEDWTGLDLSAPTNVAFGGPGLDRLFTANLAANHVSVVDAGMVGAPLHYPDIT
jgi:gluconolactonase